MADQTHTSTAAPILLSGKEIYCMLMEKIEPELLPESLPTLKEKYPAETQNEKKARSARYKKAFAEYEVQLKKYDEEWHAQLKNYKRQAISSIEQTSRGGEDTELLNLESSILTA